MFPTEEGIMEEEKTKEVVRTDREKAEAAALERTLKKIEQWMPQCPICKLPFDRSGWKVERHFPGDAIAFLANPLTFEVCCPRCGWMTRFMASKPQRKVEVQRGDDWQETRLEDIKAGEVFRLFEDPEKTVPVTGEGKSGQFVAKSDPCYWAGELRVDAAEIILKVSE